MSCKHEWLNMETFKHGCPHGLTSPYGCVCDCDPEDTERWKEASIISAYAFMRECKKCNKREWFYWNGTKWVQKDPIPPAT